MTHYLLRAYDHTDEGAMDRRMKEREDHFKYIDELRNAGKALMGGAILDDSGKMIGSSIFFDMTEEEMNEYKEKEPYITGKVWDRIEIVQCKIGPSFLKN